MSYSFKAQIALLMGLILFVLGVNHAVISFNMMYPEQPLMYLVNQKIHSISDLVSIYLHPQLLHFAIPFFRPSGYFLIYQIITPVFGWYNPQAFLVINLTFLALTGFMMIKFYHLLFPRYQLGGYVAFAIYLMHPALDLPRLIVLHFEFAYVFFLILGLYCFALFCQKNKVEEDSKLNIHSFRWLMLALFFYFLAITFKESALMLGPIMGMYFILEFWIANYKSPLQALKQNKILWQILLLLGVVSVTLLAYLTLAWPKMVHPFRNHLPVQDYLLSMVGFIKIIFCMGKGKLAYPFETIPWRHISVPLVAKIIMNSFALLLIFGLGYLFAKSKKFRSDDKRKLLFLTSAIFLTLILPVGWGMGLPWHLSLSLLFLSLILGFYVDYFSTLFIKETWRSITIMSLALMIGLAVLSVNKANEARYESNKALNFDFTVTKNAVFNPPKLLSKLNEDSVLLVADGLIHSAYVLGAGSYPFFLYDDQAEFIEYLQQPNYIKFHPSYNGTLFHWAYDKPNLKEEIYPFTVNSLEMIPSEALYNWLQVADNLSSVTYDQKGQWYDQTQAFKKSLANEQKKRHLAVHFYQQFAAVALNENVYKFIGLPYGDTRLCEFFCDSDPQCAGFTFRLALHNNPPQCQLTSQGGESGRAFCSTCIGFVKMGKKPDLKILSV